MDLGSWVILSDIFPNLPQSTISFVAPLCSLIIILLKCAVHKTWAVHSMHMLCNWSSIGICCSGGKKVKKKFMALLIATVVPCSFFFMARCGCLLGERNDIVLWFSYMSDLKTNWILITKKISTKIIVQYMDTYLHVCFYMRKWIWNRPILIVQSYLHVI